MAQYIDKDALVAEIEKRLEKVGHDNPAAYREHRYFLSFINTLEVKEVDFEKIWKEYFKYRGDVATVNVKHLAKYFFELGMQVSNKAQKGEDI